MRAERFSAETPKRASRITKSEYYLLKGDFPMKSKNITRIFAESTIGYTRFAFDNGEIHEIDNDEIVVDYAVDEAAAKKVVKKRLKSDLFRIDEIHATDTLYACSVEDFLKVTHPVEAE